MIELDRQIAVQPADRGGDIGGRRHIGVPQDDAVFFYIRKDKIPKRVGGRKRHGIEALEGFALAHHVRQPKRVGAVEILIEQEVGFTVCIAAVEQALQVGVKPHDVGFPQAGELRHAVCDDIYRAGLFICAAVKQVFDRTHVGGVTGYVMGDEIIDRGIRAFWRVAEYNELITVGFDDKRAFSKRGERVYAFVAHGFTHKDLILRGFLHAGLHPVGRHCKAGAVGVLERFTQLDGGVGLNVRGVVSANHDIFGRAALGEREHDIFRRRGGSIFRVASGAVTRREHDKRQQRDGQHQQRRDRRNKLFHQFGTLR